ncbi:LOW QUALITY PROTEIN: uncharacterized protein LOC143300649 [Babylonia areolata]|uniref:LOW QUALITY PROTEIN: uncharacterized protein LOC143300649 n=1 Tax=Babylonia areolata TaxID=304850 RepID=UPI003FCF8F23
MRQEQEEDDEEEEEEEEEATASPPPQPLPSLPPPGAMSFTLFVVLPSKDVCSLRQLASGTSIRTVRKDLELTAGLPAQTYRLTSPEGQVLHEDHVLRMDVNVWDGYVIRAVFLDSWQELHDLVVANHVQHVIRHGAVHVGEGEVVWGDAEEEGMALGVVSERGAVALFVASFLGMTGMVRALLAVGVNPNGRTPFRRTPLFAAMSRDHDAVMEALLAHNALLESRDVDGVTAVEVARRADAKQCIRKVRHLYLHSKGESTNTATSSASSGPSDAVKRRGRRVLRVPAEASGHRDPSFPSGGSSVKPRHPQEHVSHDRGSLPSSSGAGVVQQQAGSGKTPTTTTSHPLAPTQRVEGRSPAPCLVPAGLGRAVLLGQSRHTHTQRRLHARSTGAVLRRRGSFRRPAGGEQGFGHQLERRQQNWRGVGPAPDAALETLRAGDLMKGPGSVLTTTSSCTTTTTSLSALTTANLSSLDRQHTTVKTRRPSALVRFLALSPHSHGPSSPATPTPTTTNNNNSSNNNHRHSSQPPHGPAVEPPGRPPTRAESSLPPADLHEPHEVSVDGGSVLGSQEGLSACSAPEMVLPMGDNSGIRGVNRGDADRGESDDDGGRVVTSHATGSRVSDRFRTHMLVSRQKDQESWRTMKRRIRLAEEQKRNATAKLKSQNSKSPTETKESFEQWLERKRIEQHSTDDDTSGDDEDHMSRSAEHSQIVSDWLKDFKHRPQTTSPLPSHPQRGRQPKHLVEVRGQGVREGGRETDTDGYLSTYRQWQHRKKRGSAGPQGTQHNTEEAKKELEEKRKALLAMALTFQDWTEHAEKRKKLMQAILRADMDRLAAIERHLFHDTQPAPPHPPPPPSFNEWREKIDKRGAEMRHQRQRMRKEVEYRQPNGVIGGEFLQHHITSAHEEWLRRNRDRAVKQRGKVKRLNDGKEGECVAVSEDEREKGAGWLEQKHRHEVAQLNQHLRQGRQLLLSVRQKKPPTVTQC